VIFNILNHKPVCVLRYPERPNNLTVRQAVSYGGSGDKKSDDGKKSAVLGREQKRVAESPVSEMESEFTKELNKVSLVGIVVLSIQTCSYF
jgi:hypothetical protein